jgi:hypothetical protein
MLRNGFQSLSQPSRDVVEATVLIHGEVKGPSSKKTPHGTYNLEVARYMAQAHRDRRDFPDTQRSGITANLEITGGSIVVLGNFAPLTFLPDWFAKHGIIPESEAKEARIEAVLPQFAAFELSWIRIESDITRFLGLVKEGSLTRLPDLFASVFTLLSETPVSAVGLNHLRHYALGGIDQWHRLDDRLAPKEPWGPLSTANGSRRAGLRSLLMELGRREPEGYTRVKIEPSDVVNNGVYIEINDHYSLQVGTKMGFGEAVVGLVTDRWPETLKMADEIPRQLIGAGLQ